MTAEPDEPGHLLRGVRPFQRGVGYAFPGALEAQGSRVGLQMGHPGRPLGVAGGAPATVQGEDNREGDPSGLSLSVVSELQSGGLEGFVT